MFKKNKPPAEPRLGERLKTISERAAPSADDYQSVASTETRKPRKPTFRQATLALPHGEKILVVVKNLSATGARVEFFQNRKLTGKVRLIEPGSGLNTRAEVIWQSDGLLGLNFISD